MKKINWLLLFIIVAVISIILMCLPSCNTVKQEQKKDLKAENRVLGNIESIKRVRNKTNQIFPAINDTVLVAIHDTTTKTLINTIHHTDTLHRKDTTYIFHTDTAEFLKTKTIYRDKIVTDTRLLNELKDSVNAHKLRESAHNGEILQQNNTIKTEHSRCNKWMWLFIAACTVIGIIFAVKIYSFISGGAITSLFKKK